MVTDDAKKLKVLVQNTEKLKAAFGGQAFSGIDVARVLGIDPRGTGGTFKYMLNRHEVRKIRSGSYQFLNAKVSPSPAPEVELVNATAVSSVLPVADQSPSITPSLVRIGELYLHERLLLIADTARQEGSDAVRMYTTIIEVDPTSKHPRNKIINFIKARDPREYAQAIAWLDGLAGDPHNADEAALELAAEFEQKLNAARKEIAELKAKIEMIRGAL